MSKTKMADEELVEVLEPEVTEKQIVLGTGENTLILTQKPLTFFGKIEFFSVAGKAVEKILSEGNTVSDLLDSGVGELGEMPLNEGAEGVDSFVKAIASIVKYVPEVLGDLYCVILNIPRAQREEIKARLETELDDEQGFEILETFVDQNWEVLTNFFKEGILPLYQKIQTKF